MLNIPIMFAYRKHWPWGTFRGSEACLKWSFRDLRNLDEALLVTPGRQVAVQAGGNLGLFPKRLAEEFALVYTFEPDARLMSMLKFNAPEDNIIPIQAALGDNVQPISVKTARRDQSGRAVHEGLTHVSGSGKIPQMRIDDMCLKSCDLIYLDIEGYEFKALRGARDTIKRLRPVIAVELNRNIEFYGEKAEDLRAWLRSRDYKLHTSLNSDEVYIPC